MDLILHPAVGRSLRIVSYAGCWFAEVKATEQIACSRGQHHVVPVQYRREFTAEDEGAMLDAFEWALRLDSAETPEQRERGEAAAKRLADLMVDELLYSSWVDPCIIPAP
jgi:hypothetical protein